MPGSTDTHKPLRSRYRLYGGLAVVWSLLLLQALFPPQPHTRVIWVGVAFWALVEIALVAACVHAWVRRRQPARGAR